MIVNPHLPAAYQFEKMEAPSFVGAGTDT